MTGLQSVVGSRQSFFPKANTRRLLPSTRPLNAHSSPPYGLENIQSSLCNEKSAMMNQNESVGRKERSTSRIAVSHVLVTKRTTITSAMAAVMSTQYSRTRPSTRITCWAVQPHQAATVAASMAMRRPTKRLEMPLATQRNRRMTPPRERGEILVLILVAGNPLFG